MKRGGKWGFGTPLSTPSVKVLNQSLLNPHPFIKFASFLLEVFINVFYIDIVNAFTLPI